MWVKQFLQNSRALPWLILLFSLLLTVLGWNDLRLDKKQEIAQHFEAKVQTLGTRFGERLRIYEDALRASAGFVGTAEKVSRQSWRQFTTQLNLEKRYPGVRGIGFVKRVKNEDVPKFVEEMRREFRLFKVQALNESERFIVQYVEPIEFNFPALGFDLHSDAQLFTAAEKARQLVQPQLSGQVTLLQDLSGQPSFVLFFPVFRNGTEHLGWVFAPFYARDFIDAVVGSDGELFHVRIQDMTGEFPNSLYSHAGIAEKDLTAMVDVPIYGRRWRLTAASAEKVFAQTYFGRKPTSFLISGVLISLLIFGLTYSYAQSKRSAVQIAGRIIGEREEALRAVQERFEAAVHGSNDGLWHWDIEKNEVYFSPRWKEIIGYQDFELPNSYSSFKDHVHPEDWPRVERAIQGHIKTQTPYRAEFRMLHKNGSERWVLSRGQAVRDENGRALRMAGAHTDVTVNKVVEAELIRAREAALKAVQTKSEFLANISHEIRTPMNGILGLTELLLDTDLPPTEKTYVQMIRRSGDSLLKVINDVLDFSKIEAGRMSVENEEFHLRQLVNETVEIFTFLAAQKNLQTFVEIDPLLEDVWQGDAGKIRQILTNFIGNAVKFTKTGSITVKVGKAESKVLFEVVDTGIGIPSDAQAEVFNAFFQVDGSSTRRYEGTGLGLTICQRLVDIMKGQIGFDSAVGKGSRFWFSLELGVSVNQAEAPCDRLNSRIRILVAEDHPVNQMVTVRALEKFGYSVYAVYNGYEAVQATKKTKFDLILMDCQMPVMDGYQACCEIRKNIEYKLVPILALTAHVQSGEIERCLKAGMNDYLSKPIVPQTLHECLKTWLPQVKEQKIPRGEKQIDLA